MEDVSVSTSQVDDVESENHHQEMTQFIIPIHQAKITDGETEMPTASILPTVNWGRQAVLNLIALHHEHDEFFQKPEYKKKSVWEMLARRLKERGFSYSWMQVENKWKALTKNYRDVVNHNFKNGHIVTKTCAFFKEMSEVYDYSPPALTATEIVFPIPNNIFTARTGFKRSGEVILDDSELTKKKKFMNNNNSCAVQPKTDLQDLSSVLKSFNEERKRQDKIKLDRLEKMHREKMEMFSSFLKVFKDSLTK